MNNMPVINVVGRLKFNLTWAVLFLHELLIAFWKPVSLMLFLAGWLMLLAVFGGQVWLATIGATLNLAFILFYIVTGIRYFRMPGRDDALRHLEQVNGLKNRPLRALTDHLAAAGNPAEKSLWRAHLTKMTNQLSRLEFGWPAPVLSRLDPHGLRLMALVVLFVGLVVSGGQPIHQMTAAFSGGMGFGTGSQTATLDAWIDPPDYTRLPPMVLDRHGRKGAREQQQDPNASQLAKRQAELVIVPEGSDLVMRVNQTDDLPELRLEDGTDIEFSEEAEGVYALKLPVQADGRYQVYVEGGRFADWKLKVLPDLPPSVAYKGPLQITQRDSLLVNYLAQDDYGIDEIVLRLKLVGREDAPAEDFALPAGFQDRNLVDSSHYLDLTPHPWAGLNVMATLLVVDHKGQRGESNAMTLVLPQRIFTHPVARAIIAERRRLAAGNASMNEIADAIRQIAWNRQAYNSDMTVFLALGISAARLNYRKVEEQTPSVMSLLWKTALRLEDGNLSLAAQDMEAAERELLEAIANGADQAEIDRLMNQMEEAMARYLEALAQQMDQMESEDSIREVGEGEMITGEDVQSMMDRVRELLRMGMVDEAQKLLAEMREMMQNLRAAPSPFASGEGKEAMEMLKDLYDVMEQQQDLMEQTHDQAMGREAGESTGGDGEGDELSPQERAARQDQLRKRLDTLGDRLSDMMGKSPTELGNASESMGDAADALGQGRTHRAVQSQGQALNQMQEAAKAVQDSIIERFGGSGSSPQAMQGESEGDGMDPFGRVPNVGNRGNGAGETDIPDAGDVERARQIRDELRRRSGDQQRPPVELDYIDRLLTPF